MILQVQFANSVDLSTRAALVLCHSCVLCSFLKTPTDYTMTAMGGAVYAAAAATLSGCAFSNNTAIQGGAVALTDTSTVDKCTFAGNVGASNGSAVCVYAPAATVSIANSVFTDNISGQCGGGVYLETTSTLTNCSFLRNEIYGKAVEALSAVDFIQQRRCSLARTPHAVQLLCTFTSNQAHNNGGALALEVATTVEAEDCVFTGNTVTVDLVSTDIGDGGSSSQQSSFTFTCQSHLQNCSSHFTAGALCTYLLCAMHSVRSMRSDSACRVWRHSVVIALLLPSMIFQSYMFVYAYMLSKRRCRDYCSNSQSLACIYTCMPVLSDHDGIRTGAIFFTESYGRINTTLVNTSLAVTRCVFTENYADKHGGAIVNLVGTSLAVVDCTFVRNSAYAGGAVYTSSERLPTITGSNFFNNSCVLTVAGDAPEGGALAIALGTTLAVNDTTFTGNTSPSGSGGAISSSGAVTLVLYYDAVMTSNSAEQQGGAIIAHAGSVTLSSVALMGNSAGLDGAYSAAHKAVMLSTAVQACDIAVSKISLHVCIANS
eukprot:18399-Heterococcus_DN1.PRE.1